ncbi:MAG: fumarylacetoacetate hydrolase family protein [Candidatus Brocadiae bacterium]|nr:fumarylacetoacetate hydrolase family protein [Candidatus Brocadiia bacterium]
MRFVTYLYDGKSRIGVLEKEGIMDLSSYFPGLDMVGFIQAKEEINQKVEEILASEKNIPLPISSVKLLAPILNPGKIIGIGLNYADHCREQNIPVPKYPLVFAKFPSAILHPQDPISWDAELTQQVDCEAELGVVIGKKAYRINPNQALEYVFGYTIINDVSARDLQSRDKQWVRSKSLDTFCPLGPWIVSKEEIKNPQNLAIRAIVNGETRQDSSTCQMIFSVADLIAYLSRSFTLNPGDLISTGTPDGVGVFRKPPVFLQKGDKVVIEIEGIGKLENPVN